MAAFNNLALTTNGIKALLDAQAGTTLTLSKIGMGSGSTTASAATLTGLVNPELMMPITEKKVESDSGYVTIIAKMTNEAITEGFYWRETGLFYEDANGNDVLFAYACVVNDQYDYVPAYSDDRYIKHIRIANIVTDAADVVIKEAEGLLYVDTLTFAEFKEEVEKKLSEGSTSESMCAPYSEESTYSVGDYCIYDNVFYKCTTEITTAETFDVSHWKQTSLADEIAEHLKNVSNPHEVTAKQIGANTSFGFLSGIDLLEWALEQTVGGTFMTSNDVTGVPATDYWLGMLSVGLSNGDRGIFIYTGSSAYYISSSESSFENCTWTKLISSTNLANNLTTTKEGFALDARQGALLFQYASEGKKSIADALAGIGVESATSDMTFEQLAELIETLLVRSKTLVLTGTYTAVISNWVGGQTYIQFSEEFVEPPVVTVTNPEPGHWSNTISNITTTGFTLGWGADSMSNAEKVLTWTATGIGYDS